MTKEELRNLKGVIQRTTMLLNKLQKLHRQETGRDFVISGPIDWGKKETKL